jgi:hypothetical protein
MRTYESKPNYCSFSNLFPLSFFVFRFGPVLLILLSPGDNSRIVLSYSVPQITGDACLPHWILTALPYRISAHCHICS